jgi:hypothetical protein
MVAVESDGARRKILVVERKNPKAGDLLRVVAKLHYLFRK